MLSKIFGGRLIKIGISKTPKRRKREVDKAFGENRIIDIDHKVKILFAKKRERFLHKMFKGNNYKPKRVGRAGGRSEWFKVNFAQYWCIRFWMALWRLKTVLRIFLFRAFVAAGVILLIIHLVLKYQSYVSFIVKYNIIHFFIN